MELIKWTLITIAMVSLGGCHESDSQAPPSLPSVKSQTPTTSSSGADSTQGKSQSSSSGAVPEVAMQPSSSGGGTVPTVASTEQLPKFLDIPKNADGTVRTMDPDEAFQYCLGQGAHLPNARELAQLSMSLGAKGIVEIKNGKPDGLYRTINAKNAGGSLDNFYFSEKGYRRPDGEQGSNWFWSSSTYPSKYYNVFVLNGFDGVVADGNINRTLYFGAVTVRCVEDP